MTVRHRDGTADRVSRMRQAYEEVLALAAPTPYQFSWRRARFDRGLKLVGELGALGKSVRDRRVVDLGAAHGGDSAAVLASGAATVVSVDYFDYAYRPLGERLGAASEGQGRLVALRADANAPVPLRTGVADVVLSFGLIEHVRDLRAFFGEVHRVLKPSGFAVMVVDVALRSLTYDPVFGTRITGALPMPLRRFIAERVCRRSYEFSLANRTFYSSASVAKHAVPAGFTIAPHKFRDSPIATRVKGWPLASLWDRLLARYAFDFLILERRG
jgi:SAM-dependent methyltransferase